MMTFTSMYQTGLDSNQSETQGFNPLLRNISKYLQRRDSSVLSSHSANQRQAPFVQAKLSVSDPNDRYEVEADRVADAVMGNPSNDAVNLASESQSPAIQRKCAACEEEDEVMRDVEPSHTGSDISGNAAGALNAVGGGQPLPTEPRQFFESRFGADFGHVRVHTDSTADMAARSIHARAYTRGNDIVFRQGEFNPHSFAGRKLIAHELTHVIQQGGATQQVQRMPAVPRVSTGLNQHVVSRTCPPGPGPFPGDGLGPPGDCSWGKYVPLRASVVAAKAITNPLGRCTPGESCVSLAIKIAAMATEMTARIALDTTCFRGGNRGHRERVCNLINSIMRCQRFFNASGCPPELVAAMEAVVAASHAAILGGMAAVALAVIVALIAAIILLIKAIIAAIAAAGVAAGEAAAIGAAATALLALLTSLQEALSPSDEDSGA